MGNVASTSGGPRPKRPNPCVLAPISGKSKAPAQSSPQGFREAR
jgi:hypothetical protein